MKTIHYLNVIIITGLLMLNVAFAEVKTPKNPKSAKACALCHYRWVDTFFIEGKGSDLVPYQSEKVVATPPMCLSCHDGSIMDSRSRINGDTGHKTDMPPPAAMKIPKIFPLDETGKIQCATCHTAHGVPSGTGHGTTIFLRTSNKDSAMCRRCHFGMDGKTGGFNHPMGQIDREIPATLFAMSAASGKEKKKMTCETCHIAHGSIHESYLIKSGKDSGLCLDCHQDKRMFTPEGQKKPYHVYNVKPVTVKIPGALVDRGARFGRNKEIICQTCHKVHRNEIQQDLLLIKQDAKSTLCLTCHKDKQNLSSTKHNLVHTAPGEKNLQDNTVAEAGICSACHLPHKAARQLDGKADITTQMCKSCHGKGKIAENERLWGNSHPLNSNPLKKEGNDSLYTVVDVRRKKLTLPLFNKYSIQDSYGKMTCATCHDPHRWRADSSTGEIRKNVKGDRTSSFLRVQSPQICRECHSAKFHITGSEHNMNEVAPKALNIFEKTPAESGICGACHLVHGGQNNFLWARAVSDAKDGGTQQLCLSCHKNDGPARKKIIKGYSHPVNLLPSEKGITTTLPLFDSNGKNSKAGIMTCSTCHDPHRWDSTKILADDNTNLEGDSRNSFLRLENSPSAKLCENCHPNQALIEKTDHDLNILAPSSKNKLGQKPEQSGTCGVCHLAHNSKNQIRLWGQGFGRGGDLMEQMCKNCHKKRGSAQNKNPRIAFHPDEFAIHNSGRNIQSRQGYFPLFDKTSGDLINSGNISCPSCHNVHQWSSLSKEKGSGKNPEGDVSNSFLRNLSYQTICIDCHGPDAIYRYKYFHVPDKR